MAVDQAGPSLQERYAPHSVCFGCGPANEQGLRIRSFLDSDGRSVVGEWIAASPHLEAFSGMLNGGIIGALLDCHSNWTAAQHLMARRGAQRPPATVTSELAVSFRRPTPSTDPVRLRAQVVDATDDRATVEATLSSRGKVTATSRATFIAVTEGHPAFDRW
ncbi:MAG: PaaI family thioesterase [Chloroflexi bacterium]|nr:PaaI family thioesterase [Chloroflexota bacterium]